MSVWTFAKRTVEAARDFEETAQHIAHTLGVDPEWLKVAAKDLAAKSLLSPIEALQRVSRVKGPR